MKVVFPEPAMPIVMRTVGFFSVSDGLDIVLNRGTDFPQNSLIALNPYCSIK